MPECAGSAGSSVMIPVPNGNENVFHPLAPDSKSGLATPAGAACAAGAASRPTTAAAARAEVAMRAFRNMAFMTLLIGVAARTCCRCPGRRSSCCGPEPQQERTVHH
ncbi:hypothetical protein ACFQ1I_24890 [Kitasatospora arboriphila]